MEEFTPSACGNDCLTRQRLFKFVRAWRSNDFWPGNFDRLNGLVNHAWIARRSIPEPADDRFNFW
jgi:hypothetical protein